MSWLRGWDGGGTINSVWTRGGLNPSRPLGRQLSFNWPLHSPSGQWTYIEVKTQESPKCRGTEGWSHGCLGPWGGMLLWVSLGWSPLALISSRMCSGNSKLLINQSKSNMMRKVKVVPDMLTMRLKPKCGSFLLSLCLEQIIPLPSRTEV